MIANRINTTKGEGAQRGMDGASAPQARAACGRLPGCSARSLCVDGRLTLADIAVESPLGWLGVRMSEFGWRGPYPNLADLQDRLEQRLSFAKTVPCVQIVRDKVV
jgi:glutathione S-transferase